MKSCRQYLLLTFLILCSPVYAVDFNFNDLDGKAHKLSDFQGKWVVINFWATWCPPCRREIPDLADYHSEHEDVIVLGINYEPDIADKKLKKFVTTYLINYPITRINDEIIEALGEPRGLPTTMVISPDGDVVETIVGMVNERSLNKVIINSTNKMRG